jgi:hypothetical protein
MAEDLPPADRLPEDMEPDDMEPDDIEPEELPLFPMDPDDILPPVDVSLLLVPIEEPAPMSRVVWANEGALRSAPAAKVAAKAWRRVEVMVERIVCPLIKVERTAILYSGRFRARSFFGEDRVGRGATDIVATSTCHAANVPLMDSLAGNASTTPVEHVSGRTCTGHGKFSASRRARGLSSHLQQPRRAHGRLRLPNPRRLQMLDDKTNRGQQDRSRIATGEKYEVQFWTKELKVTEKQLQAAVSAVGNSADAVRRHLRQQQG